MLATYRGGSVGCLPMGASNVVTGGVDTFRIALLQNERDTNPESVEVSWSDLVTELEQMEASPCTAATCQGSRCVHKYGSAWIPADVTARGIGGVRAVTVAVLDVDGPGHQGVPDAAVDAITTELAGVAHVVHTTHQSRPGAWRLRVVIRLSRPVPTAEWDRFRSALVELTGIPADPNAADAARLFFWPSHPSDVPAAAVVGEGVPLDVDAVLRCCSDHRTPSPTVEAPRVSVGAVVTATAQPVGTLVEESAPAGDLTVVRDRLRAVTNPRTRELARIIVEGKPLAAPDDAHDKPIMRAARLVAGVAPEFDTDALLEVLRPSVVAICCPKGAQHDLDETRKKLDRALPKAREYAAQREAERVAAQAYVEQRRVLSGNGSVEGGDTDGGDEPTDEVPWHERLIPRLDPRTGEVKGALCCSANIATVLRLHPAWRGRVRLNRLTQRVEFSPGAPVVDNDDARAERSGRTPRMPKSQAALLTSLTHWLTREFQADGWNPGEETVFTALALVAEENAYEPVIEWLDGCKWDGKARLDDWLITHCNAIVTDEEGNDRTEYLRMVGRRWMISAVARAYEPGCKADSVLIFEGTQGAYKSTMISELVNAKANRGFFRDDPQDVHNKDSRIAASRSWVVELGELSTILRTDDEPLKAFLSQTSATVRPPYGRVEEEFPRRAVFIGTTNRTDYLRDPTGHRRYWPVSIQQVDLAAIRRDREQLWAEAVAVYHAAGACPRCSGVDRCEEHRWWIAPDERWLTDSEAERRALDNPLVGAVLDWWQRQSPETRPHEVTTELVGTEVVGSRTLTRSVQTEIGIAMAAIGFAKRRVTVAGVRRWVYVASEALLGEPRKTPRLASVVSIAGHA